VNGEDERKVIANPLGSRSVQVGDNNIVVNHFFAVSDERRRVRVGDPPRNLTGFYTRPEAEEACEDALRGGGITLISGAPGTGKTALAAEIFRRAAERGFEVMVWVDSTNRRSIITAFANAYTTALPGLAESRSENEEAKAVAFVDWLQVGSQSSLVVLDDLSSVRVMQGLWPSSEHVRVLITSRYSGLAIPKSSAVFELPSFSQEDAIRYFQEEVGRRRESPPGSVSLSAGELVDKLGRLPLALTLAARYVAGKGITAQEYLRILDQSPDHEDSTTQLISASIELQISNLRLARGLLELVAVLDEAGAPVEIFSSQAARNFLSPIGPSPTVAEVAAEIETTIAAGLLSRHVFDEVPVVGAHGLVREAIRRGQDDPELRRAVVAAADAMVEVWPEPDGNAPISQAMMTNALAVTSCHPTALFEDGVHVLLFLTGQSLGSQGRVGEAAALFERLAETASTALGSRNLDVLALRDSLATWKGRAGDLSGAVEIASSVVHDALEVCGEADPFTLTTRERLAFWLGQAGDLAGAVGALDEVLNQSSSLYGPDHPRTMVIRNNLALWRGQAGDAEKAAAELELLLQDRLRILGPDHPDTIVTRNNLAAWKGKSGDAVGAAVSFEKLLDDCLRLFGPDHPDTLSTRANIGFWRAKCGDSEAAISAFRTLVADSLRFLGPDHPDTLVARNNLAHLLVELGYESDATDQLRDLIADFVRIFGPSHTLTLSARSNYATALGKAGSASAAAGVFKELVAERSRTQGPDHPDTLAARNNLARWQAEAGNVRDAVREFEGLLEDAVRLLGAEHSLVDEIKDGLDDWRVRASRLSAGGAGGWDLPVGAELMRREIHDRFGGGRQAGITRASGTSDFLLFSSNIGKRRGFNFDGWKSDGAFHYSGEGQAGDQLLTRGNAAVLDHAARGFRLRLFERSTGPAYRYLGEFRVDPVLPWYAEEAPDQFGDLRKVLIFRLIPVAKESTVGASTENADENAGHDAADQPRHPTNEAVVNAESPAAERREAELVRRYVAFLQASGYPVDRRRIPYPGVDSSLLIDVFDRRRRELVESKSSASRQHVRLALGQLFDYARYIEHDSLAVLLPSDPGQDLVELLHGVNVVCIYEQSPGAFVRLDPRD
jgi:hypothetical protein